MRVLLIGDYPPPAGGIAIHVAQLLQLLRQHGIEARVFDIGKGGRPAPDVIPARGPRLFGPLLAQFLAEGWRVHLHTSGNNRTSWLLALATAAAAAPFHPHPVLTVHSGRAPEFLAASIAHRLQARAALTGYSKVIAVSAEVGQALMKVGCPRPLVLPAFLASQARPGPTPAGFAEVRARWPALVAMAYHPAPVYGLELMLAALGVASRHLPGLGLALFGPGSDSPQVAEAARAAGVLERVERFGELPHARSLGLIAGCDVFARPTSADGDALSVREALALGVRVVASDAAIRPEGSVLFAAGDRDGLAGALVRAVHERRPAPRTVDDAGPTLLALYESLMGRGGQGLHATPG